MKPLSDAKDYLRDTAERSVLFWDVLRERGDRYHAHKASASPNVLGFEFEVICDATQFDDPCNYYLARIAPRSDRPVDNTARPVVVVDPRAGHGPGIAGFKADSEIGVALENALPCYLIGFLPEPVPTQTLESVRRAEIVFLERVLELHPKADGLPFVIGNCQAGWAMMLVAATRPDVAGPILLAGAPLEYWAGHRGQNPMRYTAGMLGGSWLTSAMSAIGGGIFDGAWLVQNFESLNPANTWLGKPYGLYSKVDTEAPRFLNFETWWGGHVTMTGEEIQTIVDQLFIGNRLSTGRMVTDDGVRVDLRRVRSPVIVFCSEGDNITPPPQALGWVLDLYDSEDELLEHQQTIVYAIHETVGHLGIFVSGSVARKEHAEMTSNIDLIDTLAPGLYEMVLEPAKDVEKQKGLVVGQHLTRFEPRSLDDLRAIVQPSLEEDRAFETVSRVSQNNLALFRALVEPSLRFLARPWVAEATRRFHPLRLPYETWSSRNPLAKLFGRAAKRVRAKRNPVGAENFWRRRELDAARFAEAGLDGGRWLRDRLTEKAFFAVYGHPLVQASVGVSPFQGQPSNRIGEDPLVRQNRALKKRELLGYMEAGGKVAAFLRALIYIGGEHITYDERIFHSFKMARSELASEDELSVMRQRQISRDQYMMLRYAKEDALAAIPRMLPDDAAERHRIWGLLQRVLDAGGGVREEQRERYERVRALFQ